MRRGIRVSAYLALLAWLGVRSALAAFPTNHMVATLNSITASNGDSEINDKLRINDDELDRELQWDALANDRLAFAFTQ